MSQSLEVFAGECAGVANQRPLRDVHDLLDEADFAAWEREFEDEATDSPEELAVDDRSRVFTAQETEQETSVYQRFEKWYAAAVGETALQCAGVQAETADSGSTNLAIQQREAAAGNEEALRLITINIATAASEICFKEGHVSRVETELDENGELRQFGQSMRSVQYNSLQREGRDPVLQAYTRQEALTSFRIEGWAQSGVLKDYYVVEPSAIPDEDMPLHKLDHRGEGFFTDSMSYILRATTMQEDGTVAIESGFMAGVKPGADAHLPLEDTEGRFAARRAARHDIAALRAIYHQLGKQPPESTHELLATPLLIPKDMMPNGVADFMRLADMATDSVLGDNTTERRPEDYADLLQQSQAREASLQAVIDATVREFLAYADTAKADDPMEAVQLMWQILKRQTVEAAFNNEHIDPSVFGVEAAHKIRQVRSLMGQEMSEAIMSQIAELKVDAHEKAVISGCGGGAGSETKNGSSSSEGEESRANWNTKMGICRIVTCSTRPGSTLLGPCGVCMGQCQRAFDAGRDPTRSFFDIFQSTSGKKATPKIKSPFGEGVKLGKAD